MRRAIEGARQRARATPAGQGGGPVTGEEFAAGLAQLAESIRRLVALLGRIDHQAAQLDAIAAKPERGAGG